jgi:hypothetical protein
MATAELVLSFRRAGICELFLNTLSTCIPSALLMSAEMNSPLAIAAVASRLLTPDVLALVGKR